MRVTKATSGGIVRLEEKRMHQLVCCVCGLVHDFHFVVDKKDILVQIWENHKETQKEFNKVLKRLRKEGLPEVADRVKEMKDAKPKNK